MASAPIGQIGLLSLAVIFVRMVLRLVVSVFEERLWGNDLICGGDGESMFGKLMYRHNRLAGTCHKYRRTAS